MKFQHKLICFSLLIISFSIHAAVKTGPTKFWQNLKAGHTVNMFAFGTSLTASISSGGWWPKLEGILEEGAGTGDIRTKDKISIGAGSATGVENMGAAVSFGADLIIIEYSASDAVDDRNVSVAVCKANHAKMIDHFRANLPNAEIVLYITHPKCNENTNGTGHLARRPHLEDYQQMLRDLAAEKSTYMFDTWWEFLALRDGDTTCDHSKLPYVSCDVYQGKYVGDCSHPSGIAADRFILPIMYEVITGGEKLYKPFPANETPAGLSAQGHSDDSITLTWYDNSEDEFGFLIDRKEGSGAFVPYYTAEKNITKFVDMHIASGATYTYRLRAYHREDTTDYTNEVTITVGVDNTPPSPVLAIAQDSVSVLVVFSESVDATTAQTVSNYSINNSITISSAKRQTLTNKVLLQTSALTDKTDYTLTVSNIKDLSQPPNAMTSAATVDFTYIYVQTRNAYAKIEGESIDEGNGVDASGSQLGSINPGKGEWVKYSNVNFGADGADGVKFQSSMAYDGPSKFEMRLDGFEGQLIGTAEIKHTGGWNNYQEFTAALTEKPTGIHDLFFLFTEGDPFNIDYFTFTAGPPPAISVTSPTAAQSYKSGDSLTVSWTINKTGIAHVHVSISFDGLTYAQVTPEAQDVTKVSSYTYVIPETYEGNPIKTCGATVRVHNYMEISEAGFSEKFAINQDCTTHADIRIPAHYKAEAFAPVFNTSKNEISFASGKYLVSIFDISGRQIVRRAITGPQKISIKRHAASGVRIIKIRNLACGRTQSLKLASARK